MTNLLKIFLIFNLFSSVPANNFSVPLPETELTMGQNSSEIVKRDEPITLVGGTTVQGIWKEGGNVYQRPCTLSFPVKNGGGRLGFLTSYSCSNTNFFVGNTEVGLVLPPHSFAPSYGLDYRFVLADWNWSTDNQNMLYSPQCGENALLPIIPIADKTLFSNSEVCAFGGNKGDMVCGEILEFSVTIQVPVPGSDGEKSVAFANVVKINMMDDYDFGYMGAPVYIPVQVPDSTEFVIDPVGQIVETLDQYQENSTEPNIWYYTPIDRILEYSGLKMLSSLVPENEKPSSNQNDVSLSDNLTTSSNTSEIVPNQLDKRQNLVIFAGRLIGVSHDTREWRESDKRCTLGFPVKREGGSDPFDRGFFLLGNCLSTDTINNQNGVFFNSEEPEPTRIGIAQTSDLVYTRLLGLNFALARLFPGNILRTRVKIPAPEDPRALRFADVVNEAYFADAGTRVCATAGYSRVICGTVANFHAPWTVINPWKWSSLLRLIALGLSPRENWQNLIKVRLDGVPSAYTDGVTKYDQGSPVYWIERNDVTGARVRPVGLLYGYDFEYENVEDRCEMVYYMYCISMNLIMINYEPEGLRLLGRPPQ